VSTERLEKRVFSIPGWREKFLAQIALGRMAEPDDISKIVGFLVTDLGDYVTGQCLSVCGGAIKF
jgi:NAD(P)-dependent dehydrogenase (short-subunit alcohol dehydrogenase family)